MPYKMSKTASGKYKVSSPDAVHSKGTSKENAMKQMRLLNMIEHGGKPMKHNPHEKSMMEIKKSVKR